MADPTFVYTWNSAFLALPSDTEDFALGAQRIRDTKAAVGERFVVNHALAGTSQDGQHVHIEMQPQYSTNGTTGTGGAYSFLPPDAGNSCLFSALDSSGFAQLFYVDSDNNIIQLTKGGAINVPNALPLGTRTFFQQESAPAGWVIDTTIQDQVIRVNTSGGVFGSGGSWTISGVTVAGTVLTIAQIPAHTHGLTGNGGLVAGSGSVGNSNISIGGGYGTNVTPQSVGSNQSHTHAWSNDATWRPSYIDCIVAVYTG